MKLSVHDLQLLYHAHNRLNSAKRDVGGQIIDEPFKLDGSVRSRIARNVGKILSAVRPHERKIDETQRDFQKRAKAFAVGKDDAPEVVEKKRSDAENLNEEFQTVSKAILETELEVDIRMIDFNSLNVDQNLGITAAVIGSLMQVLENVPE